MANGIQIAVAKADMWLCQMAAWPWKRIALAVIIAAAVMFVVSRAHRERSDAD